MGASFGVVQAVQEVLAVRIGFVEALSNRRLFHVGTNFKRDIFSSLDRGAARLGDCPTMLAVLGFNAMGDAIRDILDPRMLNRAARRPYNDEVAQTHFVIMADLLQVKNLQTSFFTPEGEVRAIDGVSFEIAEGKTLGLVGESGCGKSVTSLSIMRLIPSPPGKIVGGEIIYRGKDLLKLNNEEMRKIRGNEISMIFQEPMTSLNPVFTVGNQIGEAIKLHQGLGKQETRAKTIEMLRLVKIADPESRVDAYPHQLSGGMRQRVMIAMALSCNPSAADRRRADHGARRDDSSADSRPDERAAAEDRHGAVADHPRSRRGRRAGRRSRDHVRRQDRRAVEHRGDFHQAVSSLHGRFAQFLAGHRRREEKTAWMRSRAWCRIRCICRAAAASATAVPRRPICAPRSEPELVEKEPGHTVACHFPHTETRAGRSTRVIED